MRVRATVLTLIHYPVLAGPRPNKRTAQYADQIFQEGTLGSELCIPRRNTLSDNALALDQIFLFSDLSFAFLFLSKF